MPITEQERLLAEKMRSSSVISYEAPESCKLYMRKAHCEETYIPSQEGDVHVFILRDPSRSKGCPVVVNIHGGGFVRPHAQRDIMFSAKLAIELGGIVIDVDYKLAPEYKFPVAFHECYDVAKWAHDNAEQLGADASKLIIIGHSAGGNLTAGVCLKANQTGEFRPLLQVIDYAAVDMVTDPAQKRDSDIAVIPPERARAFTILYTGNDPEINKNPFVSLCCATSDMLKDLPEAVIVSAGRDNLRYESNDYIIQLVEAGVPVRARCFTESDHGFVIACQQEWESAHRYILEQMHVTLAKLEGDI